MDYDLDNPIVDNPTGEDAKPSYIPHHVLDDEVRYLVDLKEAVDRVHEERARQARLRTAMRYLDFYDGLDPF